MEKVKSISRYIFLILIVFMILLAGLFCAAIYYESDLMMQNKLYAAIGGAGAAIIWAVLMWGLIRSKLSRTLSDVKPARKSPKMETEPGFMKKENQQNQDRIYLYMLSLLQREGRLLDFFSENLDDYADDQIGAAVRSIHENCKKVLFKQLSPKAVLNQEEGESITIDPGFDATSIKLTGNVTGEPPFKGVVRHKGWRAGKLEIPTLSSGQNSRIIAPAEIEIE